MLIRKIITLSYTVLICSYTLQAQNQYRVLNNSKCQLNIDKQARYMEIQKQASTINSANYNVQNKTAASPYKIIAKSSNVFSYLTVNTRAMQFNPDLNMVGFIFRQNNTWSIPSWNSGAVAFAWTTNNGQNWDSTIVSFNTTKFNRYPCAAIYNPAGNTNPTQAHVVSTGPWHPGSNWQGNYYASKQLTTPGTNTNTSVIFSDNNALLAGQKKQDFCRVDPVVTSDGVYRALGTLYGDVNGATVLAQKYRGQAINKGVFNAGTFSWTVDSIKPNFKLKSDGTINGYSSANMAWSRDGRIGYIIFYGVEATAQVGTPLNSFLPIVYATTNSGTSWSQYMPAFNFTNVPQINSRLMSLRTNPQLAKPFITPSEGGGAIVDANNKLHLFLNFTSASSDHPDSLAYTPVPNYGSVWNYMIDLYMSPAGWSAYMIDSLNCSGPTSTTSDWSTANPTPSKLDYDARMQISKTQDGKYIFYSWADSDSNRVADHVSTLPNIFVKAYSLDADKMTCRYCPTDGSKDAFRKAYWFYASPIVQSRPATSDFLIPMAFTKSDDGLMSGDDAVSTMYIDDAIVRVQDFTLTPNTPCVPKEIGLKEMNEIVANMLFYPNPTTGKGFISVTLKENAKMELLIFNSVGSIYYDQNLDGIAGTMNIPLDLTKLPKGLYFYQIKVPGLSPATKRLILE